MHHVGRTVWCGMHVSMLTWTCTSWDLLRGRGYRLIVYHCEGGSGSSCRTGSWQGLGFLTQRGAVASFIRNRREQTGGHVGSLFGGYAWTEATGSTQDCVVCRLFCALRSSWSLWSSAPASR